MRDPEYLISIPL